MFVIYGQVIFVHLMEFNARVKRDTGDKVNSCVLREFCIMLDD